MKKAKPFWMIGLFGMLAIILMPIIYFWPRSARAVDDPRAHLPEHPVHTSHADIVQGPLDTPQDVTRACLECHPESAEQVMHTTHWTWESQPFDVPWRDEPVTIGKANQLNNFCISAQGNQISCMTCHVGYDWQESTAYDYDNSANVDCLVCHADTALYAKGEYGNPAEGIDLLAAARSVRAPTRENCGTCHFNGGGGNGVKHGDLDESLFFPSENLDIHMGRYDMLCTDCHRTTDHVIKVASSPITTRLIPPSRSPALTAITKTSTRMSASAPIFKAWPARPVTSRPWRSKTRPRLSGIGPPPARICLKTITPT